MGLDKVDTEAVRIYCTDPKMRYGGRCPPVSRKGAWGWTDGRAKSSGPEEKDGVVEGHAWKPEGGLASRAFGLTPAHPGLHKTPLGGAGPRRPHADPFSKGESGGEKM
jgi:hypothetical protein